MNCSSPIGKEVSRNRRRMALSVYWKYFLRSPNPPFLWWIEYRENQLHMPSDEKPDDDVKELMESHDLDEESAEHAKEVMEDLGVDEDEAVELAENL